MEATGVHGWNDPIDPEGRSRRPEPPTDDPAWLTDRPVPRSSYLFGDEAASPSDRWYRDQPTEQWQPDASFREQPDAAFREHGGRRYRDDQYHHDGRHHRAVEPAGGHYGPAADDWSVEEPTAAAGTADDRTAVHPMDWAGRHATPPAAPYDAGPYDAGPYDAAPYDAGRQYDDQPGGYGLPGVRSPYRVPDTERHDVAGIDKRDGGTAPAGRRSRRLPRPCSWAAPPRPPPSW
ncbi:hypothetical protein KIF24_22400 [Micromonospora sp. Llam7]|nr:hypothetical protein [Micromonospora tarapacensis]